MPRLFEIETSAAKNTRTSTAYYDVTFSPLKGRRQQPETGLDGCGDPDQASWPSSVDFARTGAGPVVAYPQLALDPAAVGRAGLSSSYGVSPGPGWGHR